MVVEQLPAGRYERLGVSLEVEVVAEQLHYPGWVAVAVAELILGSEVAVVQRTCVHLRMGAALGSQTAGYLRLSAS